MATESGTDGDIQDTGLYFCESIKCFSEFPQLGGGARYVARTLRNRDFSVECYLSDICWRIARMMLTGVYYLLLLGTRHFYVK